MLFSVVIPLYNKADTVERALKSVRSQTCRDFEVVVVDDGSKDDGARIVNDFDGIDHLRLIRQENAGVSEARNRGVREARGEYIAFLDADDCWESEYLSELVQVKDRFPDSVMMGTGFYWQAGGRLYKTRETGKRERVDLISEIAIFQPIHTSSTAVRRHEFLEIGGFDRRHGYFEDVELMFKFALAYENRIALSRKALVRHLDDAFSTITKERVTSHRESPHLELLNLIALEDCPSMTVRRFARRYVMRVLANNSVRFKLKANVMFAAQYSGFMRWCSLGLAFTAPKWRFVVWPLAVVTKAWYWVALHRVLVRIR